MFDDLDALSDLDQLQSRYEILGELGRDGPCVVYRGRRSDREVAIKLMRASPPSCANPSARHGWQAHTVVELSHPNLLGLYAVHHLQGGALALAMEHGRHRTLGEAIRTIGPLPLAQVETVLRDVGGALGYLHRLGVVHRGVSPHSILLDRERRRALLAHFGIDDTDEARGDAAGGGALARTVAYLAPEQIDGRTQVEGSALSPQSDLYSLGLVGYAMLTGKQPWEGGDLDGVIEKRKSETLPPLAGLRPDVPENLCRAIDGALATKPARRWRSVEEFLSQLDPDAERAAPASAAPWTALLADLPGRVGPGLREGLGALGRGLSEYAASPGRRRLALAATGVLAAGAGVIATRSPPHVATDRPIAPIVVVSPSPAGESSPANPPGVAERFAHSAPAPSSDDILLDETRGSAAPEIGASRRLGAERAVRRAPAAGSRRSTVPLLGDPISPEVQVSAATSRSGVPPLLGTQLEREGGGSARDPASPGRAGGSSPR